MATLSAKHSVEVKNRILEAAADLFCRYGIKSISMDEIARHLGISKKTIYQFYREKDEIVYLVIQQRMIQDQEVMSDLLANADNPIDEMMRVTERILVVMSSINPSLFFDLQKYHPNAWGVCNDHKRNFVLKRITENLEMGIAEGLYRIDIRVDILAKVRMEQINLAFDPHIFPPGQFRFDDIQIQLLDHFLRGIVTAKGLEVLHQYSKEQPK